MIAIVITLFIISSLSSAQTISGQKQVDQLDEKNVKQPLFFIEKGPIVVSTLYSDDSTIKLQTETVTWEIPGRTTDMTLEEFKILVKKSKITLTDEQNENRVNSGTRGLNLVFDATSPPPGASTAIAAVEQYIEGLFDDPVTIYVNIEFDNYGAGILGWTSSNYAGKVSWADTCSGLQSDMDTDDNIQNYLPA